MKVLSSPGNMVKFTENILSTGTSSSESEKFKKQCIGTSSSESEEFKNIHGNLCSSQKVMVTIRIREARMIPTITENL